MSDDFTSEATTAEAVEDDATDVAAAADVDADADADANGDAVCSDTSPSEPQSKSLPVIQSLSTILPDVSPSLSTYSSNPAHDLLHDSNIASQIISLLRDPNSGAGDNNLCRWLYDTFQSGDLDFKLVVLRFVPVLVGVYLSRVARRKSLAGFEAVLLAIYAHETTRRASQPLTVNIPDLAHPSIYHESLSPVKNNATSLNLAVISASLEPYGTVRSTKRARIVGVALELYYTKIDKMPEASKIEFCEFCEIWAGHDGEIYISDDDESSESNSIVNESGESSNTVNESGESSKNVKESGETSNTVNEPGESNNIAKESSEPDSNVNDKNSAVNENEEGKEIIGRIPLTWEILQPVLRVLGHCILGPNSNGYGKKKEETALLMNAASAAIRSLYARSMHDINPRAILATGSLVRLGKMALEPFDEIDYTEIPMNNVINL